MHMSRLVQGSVLSESIYLAASAVNDGAFLCACEGPGGCKQPEPAFGCRSVRTLPLSQSQFSERVDKMEEWALTGISRLLATGQRQHELVLQIQQAPVPSHPVPLPNAPPPPNIPFFLFSYTIPPQQQHPSSRGLSNAFDQSAMMWHVQQHPSSFYSTRPH
jgi:hypothetical protein